MRDYMDNAENHQLKIRNKGLDCHPLAGFNHIAIFLRWSYANNMLADYVFEQEPCLKAALDGDGDVREVMAASNTLKGMLRPSYFKKDYAQFVVEIYSYKDIYRKKVDAYAMEFFGEERYNSAEFKNEAYLFVPYDDAYYNYLSAFLDGEWEKFSKEYTGDTDFLTAGNGENLTLAKYFGGKEEVIIPDGFITIDDYAFDKCEGVKKVVIPASVKQIKGWAFAYLNSLEQVIFSEGLEKIEREVFRGCKNLREVKLPESLKDIEYAAFAECNSLEKFEYGSKIRKLTSGLLYQCNGIQSLTIPEAIEMIGDVNSLGGLKSLIVESCLKENKEINIKNCPELTEIKFPEGFEPSRINVISCPKAEQVVIGNKVFNVVLKKNVGKLVDPDKKGNSAAGSIKTFFGRVFSSSDKKEKTDSGNRVKFHYDKKLDMYVCEYKGIQFSCDDEPEKEAGGIVGLLAESYISHVDKIIEFMLPNLKELFGDVTSDTAKSKLGKPTIEFENGRVSYFEQTFDSEHIIEFEFADDKFEKLENLTIDG